MTDVDLNFVQLRGRVSNDPVALTLPSGDRLLSFRLVVPRSGAVLRRSRQRIDVIDCAAWTTPLQRRVQRLAAGDSVQVTGALRRRFAGGASWVSVDLASVTSCL